MHFASSTLQITAISQGEIDIAAFGYTSFPLAIQNGGLSDLRIIADEIQDGAPATTRGHISCATTPASTRSKT